MGAVVREKSFLKILGISLGLERGEIKLRIIKSRHAGKRAQ
jgi:hypothetical protein